MILPTKYLSQDRALIGVGGDILAQLDEPRSVSELWARVRDARALRVASDAHLSFDWFVQGLCLLFAISTVVYDRGIVYTVGDSEDTKAIEDGLS